MFVLSFLVLSLLSVDPNLVVVYVFVFVYAVRCPCFFADLFSTHSRREEKRKSSAQALPSRRQAQS
jgi:hypothetical protein